jgi:hypothetical protein
MDPLQLLRAKISNFPGYSEELDRRHSDQLVRSYLGEALAELAARLAPLNADREAQIEALLLRIGFADQQAFGTHNCAATDGGPSCGESDDVVADDAEMIELADRGASIDASTLAAYLDAVDVLLERRDAAMRAAAAPSH